VWSFTAHRSGDCWRATNAALKKTVVASERLRSDVRHRRDFWIAKRLPAIGRELHRVVFIDETSTNTSMTKTAGWSPVGERYCGYAPLGHHLTQTFIAGLRSFAMVAPWLIDAPMNKTRFEFYLEHELAPTLNKRDVVILDNLPVHKSLRAEEIVRDQGAWMLFLPPYSPDLNPIEMAFAKLKAYLRKAAARSIDAVCNSLADICNMFDPIECRNYFQAAGYEFT
jgi:transposase